MGGTVELRSDGETGTQAIVEFPLFDGPPSSDEAEASSDQVEATRD
jgi:hypothetical protein